MQVILDTLEYATRIKKTPVVVGNCTGFAVNRVFFPYTQVSSTIPAHASEAMRAQTRHGVQSMSTGSMQAHLSYAVSRIPWAAHRLGICWLESLLLHAPLAPSLQREQPHETEWFKQALPVAGLWDHRRCSSQAVCLGRHDLLASSGSRASVSVQSAHHPDSAAGSPTSDGMACRGYPMLTGIWGGAVSVLVVGPGRGPLHDGQGHPVRLWHAHGALQVTPLHLLVFAVRCRGSASAACSSHEARRSAKGIWFCLACHGELSCPG